ncbi:hypothetical protein [Streptococcus suis]|nr:hypothetical protein [Streptococcus suis]
MSNNIEIIMNLDTLEIFEVIDYDQVDELEVEDTSDTVVVPKSISSKDIQLTLFHYLSGESPIQVEPFLYDSS